MANERTKPEKAVEVEVEAEPKAEPKCPEPTPHEPTPADPNYYPRWKYHPDHQPVIVNSASEEAALGAGWVDTPADFPTPTPTGKK